MPRPSAWSRTRLPGESTIARNVEQLLVERLPEGWSLQCRRVVSYGRSRLDLLAEIVSPGSGYATLAVKVKRMLEPRQVRETVEQLSVGVADNSPGAVCVVAASYLSPRSRELLTGFGVGYIDITGNVRIEVPKPGLFISTSGVDRDPWPQDTVLRSLRGRGAARAVRAILDHRPPFGVRELAGNTKVSAATLSRVLELLERENIIDRSKRGPVLAVDWQAAIRRWAEDYDQTTSNTATTWLEPRGLSSLDGTLTQAELVYAATGAFAVRRFGSITPGFDPIVPARTAALYVDDAYTAAERLGLREIDTGANVVLLEPFDLVVYDRTIISNGLRCVAPTQLAVDLMTGPGREPSQGQELLTWMQHNEDVWRS